MFPKVAWYRRVKICLLMGKSWIQDNQTIAQADRKLYFVSFLQKGGTYILKRSVVTTILRKTTILAQLHWGWFSWIMAHMIKNM